MASTYDAAALFTVKDIVAVVTGAGSGLGAVAAHALAANGAKAVYILGRREASLYDTKTKSPNGEVIHPIVCDVTSKEALQAAAEHIRQEIGYINVLFANSGVIKAATEKLDLNNDDVKTIQQKLWKPDMADFTETMNVNVTGAFYTTIAFLDLLDEGNKRAVVSQKSHVVLTSSIAAYSRLPVAGSAYGVSKAAVTQLMKQLSSLLSNHKIRVNAIAPGFYPSEMTQDMPFMKADKDPRLEGSVHKDLVPLERVGSEEDFAGVVLFLASRAGGYIDGVVLITDGGRIGMIPNSY